MVTIDISFPSILDATNAVLLGKEEKKTKEESKRTMSAENTINGVRYAL